MTVITLAHEQRWNWLKRMLASDLSTGTKVVLVAIWEAMDSRTGVTARLHKTIAQAVNMSPGSVKNICAKARDAGWLVWAGKGGIAHDEMGNPVPVACRFRLAIEVALADATWWTDETPTSIETDPNQHRMVDQVASDEGGSSIVGCYNTPYISPSSSPVDSPDSVVEHSALDSLQPSFAMNEESKVESPWPAASHSELAASGIRESDAKGRVNVDETETVERGVVRRVAWLLGHDPNPAGITSGVCGEIARVLTADKWQERVASVKAGSVTFETLAHWAAHNGFVAVRKDDANEAAA